MICDLVKWVGIVVYFMFENESWGLDIECENRWFICGLGWFGNDLVGFLELVERCLVGYSCGCGVILCKLIFFLYLKCK